MREYGLFKLPTKHSTGLPLGFSLPPKDQPTPYATENPLVNLTMQLPEAGANNECSALGDIGNSDQEDTWLPLDLSIRPRDGVQ
ncbi:unnamed protein product [Dibothriocephalus latus]|uniref:Uncharacterized protein n=1 Tax=Dibothriocephalus latus TaxID=60516 RepID=A0A3P7P9H9_DIBLA|nr:unnamed protein product [Dibothriocephalus latus]